MMDDDFESAALRPAVLTSMTALALLPISLLLLGIHIFYVALRNAIRTITAVLSVHRTPKSQPRKVLVTGAGTPTGLSTARLLHATGHCVIAADFEGVPYTSCARASAATSLFYALSPIGSTLKGSINASETEFFSTNVLHIAQHEDPDLWIHCGSGERHPSVDVVAQAKEIVERTQPCRVLHPDVATLKALTDEVLFANLVASLGAGLQAPETRNVFSRGEIHRVLGSWPMKRRFILEKLDPDAAREAQETGPGSPSLSRRTSQRPSRPVSMYSNSSTVTVSSWTSEMQNATVVDEYAELDALMLPSSTMNDTYDRIASIKISKTEPWSLQEIVRGEQYTAHCLVVHGELCAYVLTSDERRGSAIVHGGAMHGRILEFMQALAHKLSPATSTHLNVHFVLSETSDSKGIQQQLYPVSADVAANSTLFLHGESVSRSSHSTWRLSRLYYAAMPDSHPSAVMEGKMGNGVVGDYRRHRVLSVTPPEHGPDSAYRVGHYSLPQSILHLLMVPLFEFLTLQASVAEVLRCITELLHRIAYEQEEYLDRYDPWPWIWYWLVSFPLQTLAKAGNYVA